MTARHPFFDEDHDALRQQVKRFVEREITPHVPTWEAAGSLPRSLHKAAADAGLLGVGFPEDCGGSGGGDVFAGIVLTEELMRAGSGGVVASLMSHSIATPPVVHAGTPEQKVRLAVPVLAGEKIAALAITEPSGGSDVASLKTTAVRDGEHYVVNGSKTFITSGMRADFITTAVRTGGPGMGGISLLVIEADPESPPPGLGRTRLEKMGWHASDTATLYFDNLRVPVANRLGPENMGFMPIMMNFNQERIMLATQATGLAEVCYAETLAWSRERQTFGKPLIRNQVIRHRLADMRMKIDAAKAHRDMLAWQVANGRTPVAEVCLLKNHCCTMLEWVADAAVQTLGGAGFIRGTASERIYRETKVLTIGGGSLEIMKDLAARQMGY